MFFLKQVGDEIHFGTEEHRHVLSTARNGRFTREALMQAERQLIAAYPEQDTEITRLADRARKML